MKLTLKILHKLLV